MLKTVLFGGTFNPPHIGHEQILSTLNGQKEVEKIIIIPTKSPVHKSVNTEELSLHRLNMCRIVANKFNKAQVWDEELKRAEKSYTLLTVKEFIKKTGKTPYFIMGADMLVTLSTWYKFEELKKLCVFLAVFRKGENKEEFLSAVNSLRSMGAKVELLEGDFLKISSTEIRLNIAKNKSNSGLISKEIEDYIVKNNLYNGKKEMEINNLKHHLKSKLSEKRYFHSLCVCEEAVRLADRYGANKEKAYLAGLMHDVLKDTPPEEQLKFAKEFGIILSDLELGAPKLYHSIIGSAYLEKVLNITDKDVISAVRYHTTAKADMSLLEKIVYLADYTSRDRDYPGVDEMRKAVDISLSKAMDISLKYTIEELNGKGAKIHPDTLAAFKQYTVN